jgi:hypothetical protein
MQSAYRMRKYCNQSVYNIHILWMNSLPARASEPSGGRATKASLLGRTRCVIECSTKDGASHNGVADSPFGKMILQSTFIAIEAFDH